MIYGFVFKPFMGRKTNEWLGQKHLNSEDLFKSFFSENRENGENTPMRTRRWEHADEWFVEWTSPRSFCVHFISCLHTTADLFLGDINDNCGHIFVIIYANKNFKRVSKTRSKREGREISLFSLFSPPFSSKSRIPMALYLLSSIQNNFLPKRT